MNTPTTYALSLTSPISDILNTIYHYTADAARTLPPNTPHHTIAATPDSQDTLTHYIQEAIVELAASTARYITLHTDQQNTLIITPLHATATQLPTHHITHHITRILATTATARWLLNTTQPQLAQTYRTLAHQATTSLRQLLAQRNTQYTRTTEDYHRRVQDTPLNDNNTDNNSTNNCPCPCHNNTDTNTSTQQYHQRLTDNTPLHQQDAHYTHKTKPAHPYHLPE